MITKIKTIKIEYNNALSDNIWLNGNAAPVADSATSSLADEIAALVGDVADDK